MTVMDATLTRLYCCEASVFFFNDTATTEIYTLSLHDALPIYRRPLRRHGAGRRRYRARARPGRRRQQLRPRGRRPDRKSTRLNSSHANISYAVFCLKKKKKLFTKQTIDTYKTVINPIVPHHIK